MNMKNIYLILALALIVIVLPVSSLAFEIGVRGYYWSPSIDGTLKMDEAGVIGSNIDFEQDLGIDDEDYPSFEVFIGSDNHHLSLTYTGIDYSGSKILTRSIIFGGQTYSVSSLVTSSFKYDMLDLCYQYDFLDFENVLAGFSLGGVFQIKYLDGAVSLKTMGIEEKEDFTIPVPMLGLNLHIGLLADILKVKIRGTGITYSGNNMYEALAEVSWTPFPFMDIHGGYKVFTTDIDEDDVLFDYDMSGVFFGLTLSF